MKNSGPKVNAPFLRLAAGLFAAQAAQAFFALAGTFFFAVIFFFVAFISYSPLAVRSAQTALPPKSSSPSFFIGAVGFASAFGDCLQIV
ncbi:MAG: hypothetical protein PHE27_07110, partial [Alphaproteobacteria bacterium]|nr:hypothetical protein [Alphaproteobacteria bacterium]